MRPLSLAFNATMSSRLMSTSPIAETSQTFFFSILVKDLTNKPVCFEAVVAVDISIFFRTILFRLINVRSQHSSEGLYAFGVDVKTLG